MRRLASALAVSGLLVAGCGEEQPAETVDAFCREFQGTGVTGFGVGTREEITDSAAFFTGLEAEAPEPISDEVSTVADGLNAMAEAFGQAEAQGIEAVEAVQEIADVNLDEIASAAEQVEQYAVENCETVE